MLPNALVIGSDGTIGRAICEHLAEAYTVHRISRSNCDYSEQALQSQAEQLAGKGPFSKIICTIGVLHDDIVNPEKRLKDIAPDRLLHYFEINTVLPMLCLKHFQALLDKTEPSVFASLSAMVGSTADNHLGGWYGYRASKAALNSLIKTASIELSRTHKLSSIIAIHPGTTVGALSAPFAKRVKPENYYTPEQSARRIITVLDSVTAGQSGQLLNWDGQQIPW